jgi:ubiquinone biosynthesis protein
MAVKGQTHSHHLSRYRQVATVLYKYQLRELIQTLGLERFLPLHWMPPGNPWQKQVYSQPERSRMALEELGTTFVKLGQILSTRTDIVPSSYARELVKLQDSLRPFPVEPIKTAIREELGRPVDEIFSSFDSNPLGVASIGQVHAATLLDRTEVVVKVRKPGVKEQVTGDLEIMRQLAGTAAQRWKNAQRYDLSAVVEELAETLTAEMDYIQEGHNAEYFARFFEKDPKIQIPKVFWEYTTSQIITLERVKGINVLDVPSLEKAGFDLKDLAKRSVNLWQKMVFDGEVYHADPHPGNLFVETDGRIGLIDFGMIGIVDEEVQEYLASAVRAILDRDVDLLLDSLIELGAVRVESSRQDLRTDLKHIMGHYPKYTMSQWQSSSNLGELLAVIRRNHVQLPSNTFLLLKTMAMAQSLGKGLDPDFDILPLLEPNVKQVLKKRRSLLAIARRMPSATTELANLSVGLPQRLNRLVRSIERGELQVRTDVSGLEHHLEHLERLVNRIVLGVVVAAIFIGLAIIVLAFKLAR